MFVCDLPKKPTDLSKETQDEQQNAVNYITFLVFSVHFLVWVLVWISFFFFSSPILEFCVWALGFFFSLCNPDICMLEGQESWIQLRLFLPSEASMIS